MLLQILPRFNHVAVPLLCSFNVPLGQAPLIAHSKPDDLDHLLSLSLAVLSSAW